LILWRQQGVQVWLLYKTLTFGGHDFASKGMMVGKKGMYNYVHLIIVQELLSGEQIF